MSHAPTPCLSHPKKTAERKSRRSKQNRNLRYRNEYGRDVSKSNTGSSQSGEVKIHECHIDNTGDNASSFPKKSIYFCVECFKYAEPKHAEAVVSGQNVAPAVILLDISLGRNAYSSLIRKSNATQNEPLQKVDKYIH